MEEVVEVAVYQTKYYHVELRRLVVSVEWDWLSIRACTWSWWLIIRIRLWWLSIVILILRMLIVSIRFSWLLMMIELRWWLFVGTRIRLCWFIVDFIRIVFLICHFDYDDIIV